MTSCGLLQVREAGLIEALNVNTLKELTALKGIGKKRAENIISFRTAERPFVKKDDLRLCGFSANLVNKLVIDNELAPSRPVPKEFAKTPAGSQLVAVC